MAIAFWVVWWSGALALFVLAAFGAMWISDKAIDWWLASWNLKREFFRFAWDRARKPPATTPGGEEVG